MQQINELRRCALEMLRQKICGQFHREYKPQVSSIYREQLSIVNDVPSESEWTGRTGFSVLVGTMEQLEEVCNFPDISRIYIDSAMFGRSQGKRFFENLSHKILRMQEQGTEVYLAMPHIFRRKAIDWFEECIEYFSALHFNGVLLRNYESYRWWKTAVNKGGHRDKKRGGFDKNVILDQTLYVMNQSAKAFWNRQGVSEFTVPAELNRQEILKLGAEHMEMLIYGYLPVMVSAQCIVNTVEGCQRVRGTRVLTDRHQNNFYVENRCEDCYNVIYNPVPLCLFDEKAALEEIHPSRLRLQFSVEDRQTTRRVLQEFRHVFLEGGRDVSKIGNFTRGHFRRGVI